ncbi:uncharacterized protein LOC135222240 [Macrobrachium nipponense]|uniref:uncharacterized protein LOC135222240 n=1 Tax=Macrobrachium nipponense TaxID=159736 RepID=UPI0030C8D1AD
MKTTSPLIALILMTTMDYFAKVAAQNISLIGEEVTESPPKERLCESQCTDSSSDRTGVCRESCQQGEIQVRGNCPAQPSICKLLTICPDKPCVCCVRDDKLPVCKESFCTGGRRGESGTCRTECLQGEKKIADTCGRITEDTTAGACVCCGRDDIVTLPTL